MFQSGYKLLFTCWYELSEYNEGRVDGVGSVPLTSVGCGSDGLRLRDVPTARHPSHTALPPPLTRSLRTAVKITTNLQKQITFPDFKT